MMVLKDVGEDNVHAGAQSREERGDGTANWIHPACLNGTWCGTPL
jgi:hypothetical protein